MDREDVLIIGGLAVLLGLCIAAAVFDEKSWNTFSAEHKCKVNGHISSSSVPSIGVAGNGQSVVTTTFIPAKTGWLCDDGITYWR